MATERSRDDRDAPLVKDVTAVAWVVGWSIVEVMRTAMGYLVGRGRECCGTAKVDGARYLFLGREYECRFE